MVTFVAIETPESDFVYRVVNDPKGPNAAKPVDQAAIGLAGAGALFSDLATNAPVSSESVRDHHVFGATLRKEDSIGIQNTSLDLRGDPATCTQSGPVRLCPARQAKVARLLAIVRLKRAMSVFLSNLDASVDVLSHRTTG